MAIESTQNVRANVYPVDNRAAGGAPAEVIQSVKDRSKRFIRPALDITYLLSHKIPGWKRAVDIIGSLAGLILLSPLFLIHCVIMKIISPGPVFYMQERVGKLGRIFEIYKFRTMKINGDASGHCRYVQELIKGGSAENSDKPMTKLDGDSRIIPGTHILRKTAFDELPQLINVLRGDMSLVGPRPCIPYEAQEYLRWHKKRFDITPGMTGLWQVSGKNKLTFRKMIRLDIQYQNQYSFFRDMKILLKTPPALVSQVKDSLAERRSNRKAAAECGTAN